jgi:hypothetical protein
VEDMFVTVLRRVGCTGGDYGWFTVYELSTKLVYNETRRCVLDDYMPNGNQLRLTTIDKLTSS